MANFIINKSWIMLLIIIYALISESFVFSMIGAGLLVITIISFHIENAEFCKKLNRIASGEKNIKF